MLDRAPRSIDDELLAVTWFSLWFAGAAGRPGRRSRCGRSGARRADRRVPRGSPTCPAARSTCASGRSTTACRSERAGPPTTSRSRPAVRSTWWRALAGRGPLRPRLPRCRPGGRSGRHARRWSSDRSLTAAGRCPLSRPIASPASVGATAGGSMERVRSGRIGAAIARRPLVVAGIAAGADGRSGGRRRRPVPPVLVGCDQAAQRHPGDGELRPRPVLHLHRRDRHHRGSASSSTAPAR